MAERDDRRKLGGSGSAGGVAPSSTIAENPRRAALGAAGAAAVERLAGQTEQRGPVGVVSNVTGDATVTDGGKTVRAVAGTPIRLDSVLKTGKAGSLGITFNDNQVMSFGPDTEVVVDEYLYASAKGDLKLAAGLGKGTLNVVSGVIQKLKPEEDKRPGATYGVRG